MIDYVDIGRKLKLRRQFKNLTLAELGKIIQLHASTVKKYEDGLIKNIDINTLNNFSKALEISIPELLGLENTKKIYDPVSDTKLNDRIIGLAAFLGISEEDLKKKIIDKAQIEDKDKKLNLIDDSRIKEAPVEIQEDIIKEINNFINYTVDKFIK